MTGVGGDCFALVKSPRHRAPLALNGSGWAPGNVDAGALNVIGECSAHAVTVPGAVSAWKKLHDRFGRLPWRGLFTAAIRYAAEGAPVAARVALDWQESSSRVASDTDAANIFLPEGKAPQVGDIHRQPKLAATLAAIADDGGRSFYKGAIAEDIVGKLKSLGGAHELSDFAEYKAQWQTPIAGEYRGRRIWQCPPNGQGAVVLLMLAAMSQIKDWQNITGQRRAHYYAIITRLAYQWRDNNIGDDIDAAQLQKQIADEAANIARFVQSGELPPPLPAPPPQAEHRDTVYLAAIDKWGLCVSFINSIFHPFGSGIVAPQSGVLLHNRGASFSLREGSANKLAPRKRPMHTIIPAIAESENETAAFGVMGGHYQAAGQAWFLCKWLDEGMNLQQALDAPRFFNYPDAVYAEPTLHDDVCGELKKRGHKVVFNKQPLGGGQAVMRLANGVLVAASDTRKDGMAVGY